MFSTVVGSKSHTIQEKKIKKILKADYPRGRANWYLPAAGRLRQLYFGQKAKNPIFLISPFCQSKN
jgi:hypothetical protein